MDGPAVAWRRACWAHQSTACIPTQQCTAAVPLHTSPCPCRARLQLQQQQLRLNRQLLRATAAPAGHHPVQLGAGQRQEAAAAQLWGGLSGSRAAGSGAGGTKRRWHATVLSGHSRSLHSSRPPVSPAPQPPPGSWRPRSRTAGPGLRRCWRHPGARKPLAAPPPAGRRRRCRRRAGSARRLAGSQAALRSGCRWALLLDRPGPAPLRRAGPADSEARLVPRLLQLHSLLLL